MKNVLLILSLLLTSSCSELLDEFPNFNIGENITNSSSENIEEIQTVKESQYFDNDDNKKYRVIDSFELADGNYYYFYYLGLVDYVPLDLSNAIGTYFNGTTSITLEMELKNTIVSQSVNSLSNVAKSSVDLKTETYANASVGVDFYKTINAKAESGIKNSATNSITKTLESSVQVAVKNEQSFSRKITYKMQKGIDEKGFYLYTSVASMKIYEIVVYNPMLDKIECMMPYCEIGTAVPGLYFSSNSFFDYNIFDIEFNESKMPEFEKPSLILDKEFRIDFDANGGQCDTNHKLLKIGLEYGELPIPTREFYTFEGWYNGDDLINSDSIVINDNPIVAKWKVIDSVDFCIENSFHVQNGVLSDTDLFSSLNLSSYFDFIYLKENGYKLQIILSYDVRTWVSALGGAYFNIIFASDGNTIFEINDKVRNDNNYHSSTKYSNILSIDNINGEIDIDIQTDNINPVYFQNFNFTLKFRK